MDDAALEAIRPGAAARGRRTLHPEQVAQFDQELRGVGALGLLGRSPTFDECLDSVQSRASQVPAADRILRGICLLGPG